MASLLLGQIGSSLLGPFGGFLGSALGSYLDNLLFASLAEPQEGPRIEDTTGVAADPGAPIPLVYGADRLPGIIVATTDLIETKNKKRVGGKGGGQKVITYTYHVDIDYMLCEGPILGIARIWADGNLVRGTEYEMDSDTSEHPENIGGIPYPDRYKDRLYQPSLIPDSFDTSDFTATGVIWHMTADGSAMVPGEGADAPRNRPSYNQDSATNYFIPTPDSHAYTGEKFKTEELEGYKTATETGETPYYTGNEGAGVWHSEIMALGEVDISTDSPGYTSAKYTLEETLFASGGLTNSTLQIQMTFFKAGSNGTLDETDPATKISTHFKQSVVGVFTGHDKLEIEEEIPLNADFIVFEYKYALVFPLSCDIRIDTNTLTATARAGEEFGRRDWPDYWNLYDAINDWSKYAVLGFDLSDSVTVYHGSETQPADPVMQAAELAETISEYPGYVCRAHVVFETLQLEYFGNRIPNMTFEVVQFDDTRLSAVISDMMDRAGVDSSYYDLSALPGTGIESHILGYSVSRKTNYRAALEPLLEAFRVDAAEIGNQLVFRPRDRSVDYVIDIADLAAVEAGKSIGDTVKLTYRDRIEMPRMLTVTFKDVEKNYQRNTAQYRRQQGISVQDSSAELPVVIPKEKAKQYARNKMRDIWLERTATNVEAMHKLVYLAPSDYVKVDGSSLGESSFTFKVIATTRGANGIMEIEGVLREDTLYIFEDGETDPAAMDTIYPASRRSTDTELYQTLIEFYDGPPLREVDDNTGFYIAMGGTKSGWRGSVLFRAPAGDGVYDELFVATASAVIGNTLSVIGSHDPEYIDTTNTVRVVLINPNETLESVTIEQMLQGKNAAILGDEVINFANATHEGNGVYLLDTFLRGRRGTDEEARASSSQFGDRFILLEAATVTNFEDVPAFRGSSLSYKPVTFGGTLADTSSVSFTNTGQRVVPLSPIHITGTRDGGNDLTIKWTRRDRLYHTFLDNSDIPMSEASEKYEVDIKDGATVVRTISVSDATQVVYTSAEQTSDGLTPGDPVTVDIYQISDTIGRGNAGTGVV